MQGLVGACCRCSPTMIDDRWRGYGGHRHCGSLSSSIPVGVRTIPLARKQHPQVRIGKAIKDGPHLLSHRKPRLCVLRNDRGANSRKERYVTCLSLTVNAEFCASVRSWLRLRTAINPDQRGLRRLPQPFIDVFSTFISGQRQGVPSSP